MLHMACLTEEERRIREQLHTVSHFSKTSPKREEVYRSLIKLSHSEQPDLRKIAAQNLHAFFPDFPQYEEDVIDAIYDLCEDFLTQVRIEGYRAIVLLSKTAKDSQCLKRNVDALLQLLQIDSSEELAEIKKALVEHLDLDLTTTVNVLREQLTSPKESIELDDHNIPTKNDSIQSCIIQFLTEDARKYIVGRVDSMDNKTRAGLQSALAATIYDSSLEKAISLVDLLLEINTNRNSYNPLPDIFEKLLSSVQKSIVASSKSGIPFALLESTRLKLEKALFISVERHQAPIQAVINLALTCLLPSPPWNSFAIEDKLWILSVLSRAARKSMEENDITGLESMLPFYDTILQTLLSMQMALPESWEYLHVFLNALGKLQSQSDHLYSPSYQKHLKAILDVGPRPLTPEIQGVQRIIVTLLRTPPKAQHAGNNPAASGSPSSNHISSKPSRKGHDNERNSLSLFADRLTRRDKSLKRGRPQDPESEHKDKPSGVVTTHGNLKRGRFLRPSTVIGREGDGDVTHPPVKRSRVESDTDPVSTLLARFSEPPKLKLPSAEAQHSNSIPSLRSTTPHAKPHLQNTQHPEKSSNIITPPLMTGFNIKGAALKEKALQSNEEAARRRSLNMPSPTLIERIKSQNEVMPKSINDGRWRGKKGI